MALSLWHAKWGTEVKLIARTDFNHGAKREMERKKLGTGIVIVVAQGAFAVDKCCFTRLLQWLLRGKADVASGRHLTKDAGNIFEPFPREYNYPAESHQRQQADINNQGACTFFGSNLPPIAV